jgi:hypothetical protein
MALLDGLGTSAYRACELMGSALFDFRAQVQDHHAVAGD